MDALLSTEGFFEVNILADPFLADLLRMQLELDNFVLQCSL